MKKIERASRLFVEISELLISSGANTRRVLRNVERIAEALGYNCEIFYSHSAVIMTVYDKVTKEKETLVRSITHHGVNFSVVSDISVLSWQVVEEKLSIEEIEREVTLIQNKPHYNMYLMWFFVAVAGGALAFIFGGKNGSYAEFVMAFVATFVGLASRRLLQLRKFNPYICWAWAAFVSVSVVNTFRLLGIEQYGNALASCVLWLIPGVPLINGFIDILTGSVISGGAKLLHSAVLVFMIASGFYISLFLFGYELL
ncbi:threonine/serine ThrE exporter family protein [Capnocytophaga felis]|uniref:Membrane protein n=1 Tax=Capnocytophaga felis TaxID=2267611 RepID=A0A5M4BAJ0_9FLAO|nr:threonine/serine exporter family protein [Capnocytophaga felis]GET46579.1 membrane protein [Capnocytophaga felis]GET49053.1 membrane protein [Capnocytophaga felis]